MIVFYLFYVSPPASGAVCGATTVLNIVLNHIGTQET
jgi:hypothetical protein